VHQIITELTGAVSEEDRVMVITKMLLNLMQQEAARVHKPFKVIEFNANGI
jgi:hypothetical protein